jgi:hypothetical protein
MNIKETDNLILANRGNNKVLDGVIETANKIKTRIDWEMDKFLRDHVKGIEGIKKLEVNTASPLYRYYNHKIRQYGDCERIIRVATAFKV